MPDEPQENQQPIAPIQDIIPQNDTNLAPQPVVTPDEPIAQLNLDPVITPTPTPIFNPSPAANLASTPVVPVSSDPVVATETPVISPGVVQTTTPQPIVPDLSSAQPVVTKPKKSKKFIAGVVISIILALSISFTALGFNYWYQDPQKVLSDAIVNAVISKASIYSSDINIDSNGTRVKISITTKQADYATGSLDVKITATYSGKSYSIDTSALIDKNGDLYFKLSNLTSIVAEAKTAMGIDTGSTISDSIDNLVSKIDGTWVKISSADIKQYSSTYATTKTCVNDAMTKFENDSTQVVEVIDAYKKNPFLLIDKDLGQKDGNFNFQIKGSTTGLKAFIASLKTTKIYNAIHDCDSSFTIDENSIKDNTSSSSSTDYSSKLILSIDYWSHQITKIDFSGSSDANNSFTAVIVPQFSQKVTIDTPATSISLTELSSYIQQAYDSFYSTYQ